MAKMKYSRQREAIVNFLASRKDHPSADVIYENIKIKYPSVSLGTVYRNLSLLSEIGTIQKISGQDASEHYDGRTDLHAHFICQKCSRLLDFDNLDMKALLTDSGKEFPGKLNSVSTLFYGVCQDCLGQSDLEDRTETAESI